MKSRGKSVMVGCWNLGLPSVFLLCLFFFLLGLLASSLFSQQDVPNVRPRVLESVDLEKDFDPLPTGETGDHSLTSIPFQVLSWFPRVLYFPNFASIEQCQSIIKIAKANLEPSSLALRKGETEETTKGIRTSSGTFISASEDKTGILDLIEEKIAKATMIPKTHSEAFNVLRYELAKDISHIMMLSILLNMALRRAKGSHPSYYIYLMLKKVGKLCSLLRTGRTWMVCMISASV